VTRPIDPGVDPEADAPEWWRRSSRLRRLPLIVAIVIAVILLRAGHGASYPAITKSCTTPSFVLSTTKTPAHRLVQWSVTGPATLRFVLGVGVSGYQQTGQRFAPIPDPGVSRPDALTSDAQILGGDCVAHGQFSLVDPGTFTVRLFSITGPVGSQTVSPVQARTLTVTAS
jgi:hypothetical protein